MAEKIITREFIASKIDDLLTGKIKRNIFGEEMFQYCFLADEYGYKYEEGYDKLFADILDEFLEMHDLDKGDVGYTPYCPTKEEIEYFRDCFKGQKKWIGKMIAREDIPELLQLIRLPGNAVRFKAMLGLSKIGATEAIPEIKKILDESRYIIRGEAAIALIELGAKDQLFKDAIDDIKSIIKIYENAGATNNDIYNRAKVAFKKITETL